MSYNLEVASPNFDSDGLADKAGWVKVYTINQQTREYVEARYEHVVKGTGVAAGSYTDAPSLPPTGYALVRTEDGLSWASVPDYRGHVVYNKETASPSKVDYIGEIDGRYTLLVPSTEFDEFVEGQWVTNTAKQREVLIAEATDKRARLISVADIHIEQITSAINAGEATDEESSSLAAWETYRRQLYRINPSDVPNITWPKCEAIFYLPGYEVE